MLRSKPEHSVVGIYATHRKPQHHSKQSLKWAINMEEKQGLSGTNQERRVESSNDSRQLDGDVGINMGVPHIQWMQFA